MGHQITKKSTPRRGSLQYYPITKSKKPYNTFSSFVELETPQDVSVFAGYKAGMTHVSYVDNDKNSPTFKMEVISPATIIECPPLLVCAIRFYKNGVVFTEIWGENLPKEIKRRVFTGSVKRFGVKIYPVHASKSRRKAGNLGAETMAKVQYTVPQHGRLGFNSRVEYNKFVLRVFKDGKELNDKNGLYRYGYLSSSAVLLKGSVPGSTGRLVRPIKKSEPVKVNLIR